ncbi:hypothetical protein Plec18167_009673 [Paecilomyces lecythidis]|uniref:Uncharacterized protein n=1 Tax=Paecilomyces lecythidis TaxID=3004212 RepID=A0ABR3WM52_9EURO
MDISSLLNPQGKEDNQETAEFAEVPFSSTPRFPQTGVGEHIAMAPAYSALVNGTDSSSPVLAMPLGGSAEPHVKSKWSESEDMRIIELRGRGMKWEDISRKLPGRSATSCRLHYQNYLERRCYWDEEKKTKLAVMYDV